MPGIEIRNLVKQWEAFRAVDDVSFDVPQGSLTVLLGPSGCGKSTILRMIAGLEDVSDGTVAIGGRDITRQDAAQRGVSMVFQSYALFPHLNVRENILFGLKVRRVAKADQETRLAEAAALVGLEELLDRMPAKLSGGQRQRVALARTIVSSQPVCLMDEPLSNLDAKLRAEMRDEIHRLQRKLKLTMVYVTHDQTEAMSMADEVVLLKDGRIEQIGPPAALYETPETAFAARFLGMPPMNVMPMDKFSERTGLGGMVPDAPANWRLGVRPEKIHISEQGLPVVVDAVDYMGAETVLRVHSGPLELMARIDGRALVEPGDELRLSWAPADIHMFDDRGKRRDLDRSETN
ncbi:MAG: ABC transporter ATP-binding protein [Hyphomicrobiales bacterium]|nr:MAG: ABC transporter ATP-binding protein [Hyphomicrobiales bacterium]